MAEAQPRPPTGFVKSVGDDVSVFHRAGLSLGHPERRRCWLVHYGCRVKSVVALVISDSHTCGTVRSAQETVKHIARVSVTSGRGTLKILTTETSDLGPVVLSA